jgi:hypothetical protein
MNVKKPALISRYTLGYLVANDFNDFSGLGASYPDGFRTTGGSKECPLASGQKAVDCWSAKGSNAR